MLPCAKAFVQHTIDWATHPTFCGIQNTPERSAKVLLPPEVQKKFLTQDQEYLVKNDPQLQEWWNKVFKT